ncbi:hypothetical protein BD414DRAFT_107634 [Trametes punicea]|nr:hypothetical protein BD414DRAFT_107634 [Trametes punicea]
MCQQSPLRHAMNTIEEGSIKRQITTAHERLNPDVVRLLPAHDLQDVLRLHPYDAIKHSWPPEPALSKWPASFPSMHTRSCSQSTPHKATPKIAVITVPAAACILSRIWHHEATGSEGPMDKPYQVFAPERHESKANRTNEVSQIEWRNHLLQAHEDFQSAQRTVHRRALYGDCSFMGPSPLLGNFPTTGGH